MKYEKYIKLSIRYIIIFFIIYLAWMVTGIPYITALGPENTTTLNVIIGSVFSALTLILNFHFSQKVEE